MKRKSESAAQPAHPADRFAREIVGMLERNTTRSRRLMREALGRAINAILVKFSAIRDRCIIYRSRGGEQVRYSANYKDMPKHSERNKTRSAPVAHKPSTDVRKSDKLTKLQVSDEERKALAISAILQFLNVIVLFLAFLAFNGLFRKATQEESNRVPPFAFLITIFVAPVVIYGYTRVQKGYRESGDDAVKLRKWSTIQLILTSLVMTVLFLPNFYALGYAEAITKFLTEQVPTLGDQLIETITNTAAFLTSGLMGIITSVCLNVLSNYIYDRLKDRRSKRNNKRTINRR